MWGGLKRKCDSIDSTKENECQAFRRRKETRTIKMGWGLVTETGLKIIRSNQGGGPAHNFSVSKQCTKSDLIAMGKHIFFPNQKSTIGHESEFTFDIQLGRGDSMGDDDTVESFFVASKNCYLRLYLACTRLSDLPRLNECHNNHLSSVINDEFETEMVKENMSNDAVYVYKEIKVKKSSVFDDLLLEFCNEFWTDCDLNFVYVNVALEVTNGESVIHEEKQTTFQKCLTIFWKDFYALCTRGTKCKVPILRHDFGYTRWVAVARILAIGWVKMRYLPILLSPLFINACLGQEPSPDLVEPFLLSLPPNDAKILSSALTDFNNADKSELIRILAEFNVRSEALTRQSLVQLLQEVAHLVHIQQPSFIIQCWKAELKSVALEITQESLQEIYKNLIPTSDRIISVLRFDQINSGRHESACGFLKRFMRDSDSDTLARFLQFITGSDMLTVDEIFVAFADSPGFSKNSPASYTPSDSAFDADLFISTSYNNYDDFHDELNSVLCRD